MRQGHFDRLLEGLESQRPQQGRPDDFEPLPTIPAGRYTDALFLKLEKERLWGRSWLYACHADQLPESGSFVSWEKTGSPVVFVRCPDGSIRAFYNTCRHRGGPLVKATSGKLKRGFVCAFHGWSYDLDGRLVGVRDREDFGELDFDCHSLKEIRCESFGKWVFLNEDTNAEPLKKHMGAIAEQWRQLNPDTIRHIASSSHIVECNCKMMLEAFLEVYHLQTVHVDTVGRFLDYRASTHVLWHNGHSLMLTPNKDPDWVDPGTRGMPTFAAVGELPGRVNVSYNLYPNLITPVAPTGIPFLLFWPLSDTSTQVDCHWFSPDWGEGERHELWDTRMRNFERILEEDLEIAPYLQKSATSGAFDGGQLSFQERRIYHWHEELDRRIGQDEIPTSLSVTPCMEKFIMPFRN
jgi:phenylpropionate dioxygenase-like ring-hydroxylating dioxygenase large terminal subunit